MAARVFLAFMQQICNIKSIVHHLPANCSGHIKHMVTNALAINVGN